MNKTNTNRKARIIFLGTPEFAVPSLAALADSELCEVCAVITQPDKPAGRGQKLSPSPIKKLAIEKSITVFQPLSLKTLSIRDEELRPFLEGAKSSRELAEFLNEAWPIDLGVTAAYGKIIPPELLSFPRLGMVNVHPSLLPRWRGAAPLQQALFNGDQNTGVSIMQVDDGLDTGPVYCKEETPIADDETLGSLHDKLASLGAAILARTLPRILDSSLTPVVQSEENATYAEKWDTKDSTLKWEEDSHTTLRRIRTCNPIPGARTSLKEKAVKIYSAHQVANQNFPSSPPGTIVEANKAELIVAVGTDEYLAIDEMQFPGKKRLSIADVLRGKSISVGDSFK